VPEDAGQSEGFFGERIASQYDERAAAMFDPAVVGPVVELLAGLAGEGRALEFAIGTGRVALPLAEHGVPVAGIDNSEAMVARLRTKTGADDIDVAIGDFATTRVDGEFSLVYLVSTQFSTWSRRTRRSHASRTRPPISGAEADS